MSTDAAIQKDVVDSGKTQIELDIAPEIDLSDKTDRETIMDRIAERRREEVALEMSDVSEADLAAAKAKANVEADVGIVPDPKVVDSLTESYVTKIDGVDGTATEKEIRDVVGGEGIVTDEDVRQFQKSKSADARLEASSIERKELAERRAELDAREARLAEREVKPPPVPAAPAVDSKRLASALIAKTFAEDGDGVAEIIDQIRSQPAAAQSATLSNEAVDRAVKANLLEKERVAAVKRFADEYSVLEKNSGLRNAVDQRSIVERRLTPDATIWEVIDRAAKYVKKSTAEALGYKVEDDLPVVPADKVVTNKEGRVDAKRAAGPAVKATAATTAPTEVPKKKETSPFQQIAKARGQG